MKRMHLMVGWVSILCCAVPAVADRNDAPAREPRVIVEGWLDRENCSDLYAFDFAGVLLRRLTAEPLPSCSLAAVSSEGDQIAFNANASALYCLHERHHLVVPLYAGDVGPVAMSPKGDGIAYVARGFEKNSGQFLFVQPLLAGAAFERIQISLTESPAELTFSRDSKQVLLTTWTDGRARIDRCDLRTRKLETLLSDPLISYYEPTFTADGKTLAVISENNASGESMLIGRPWPTGDLKAIRPAPLGVALSTPVYTDDGTYLLFEQDGVLARVPSDGGKAEGLSGPLDETPRPINQLRRSDRAQPARRPSTPLLVHRWIARLENDDAHGKVVVINVQTKEKRVLLLPKGRLLSATVVE